MANLRTILLYMKGTHSIFLSLVALVSILFPSSLFAVNDGTGYNTSSSDLAADVPNWSTGWGQPGTTGWDYVGSIAGGGSAVYLGNGWVITAAHINAGTFTLDGTSYNAVTGTTHFIGSSDLVVFQIAGDPSLPTLTLATTSPAVSTSGSAGSGVVMIGFAGGKSWGYNHVTNDNVTVPLDGTPYTSTDFVTALGQTAHHDTNNAYAVIGDSGGAGFIYDSASGTWKLAGILEGVDTNNDTLLVDLSVYATTINQIVATPEPSSLALAAAAVAGGAAFARKRLRLSRGA